MRVDDVLEIAKEHFQERLNVTYKEANQEIESQTLELDPSCAIAKLGWRPQWNQEEAIDRTFMWWAKTLANPTCTLENCLNDIEIALGKQL